MVRSIFEAYESAYSGLSRGVWILSFALFINRCGTMVLPFLTLYLREEMGFVEGHAAMMLSCYGVGSLFGVYTGGWLTDRVGAVRLMIIMLALSAPMFILIPLMQTAWQIAGAILVLAFFNEAVRPANGTAITQFSTKENLTRSFGLQRMALNLGISFGPAIGGFLAEVNFMWLFVADGVTTLACAVVVWWLLGLNGEKAERPEQTEEGNNQLETESPASVEAAGKDIKPHQDPTFIMFLALLLLGAIVFFQFHATYPLYLADHFLLTKFQIGLIFAVNTVIVVVFEMLLVDRAKKWSILKAIGWGVAFSCFGFGVMPFSSAIWFAVFSMIIITIGEMLSMPLASGWVGHRSNEKHRGMYMAWYSMTYSVAAIIAPALGGVIYQSNHDTFWYISIGIGFVALFGFYHLARHVENRKNLKTIQA